MRCAVHTPRRLQQIAISCKRSDYNHFFLSKKTCQSVTLSSFVRKRLKQVALFFDAAHSTSSEVIHFDEFMSSTSGHSTATICTGRRRRRKPFLILVQKNRCKSLFSRLTVKTVQCIVNASRKSDRSFIGAFLPDVFSEIYQFSEISQTPQLMGNR